MKMTGNTILITGGGSGIGLALAEAFAGLGNEVIIAARSPEKLANAENRGLKTLGADVSDKGDIEVLAKEAIDRFPALNVVIHNAGICRHEDLIQGGNSRVQEETIATNILGPMRLTEALLPHLLKQSSATIMIVSSGLAFVPAVFYPTYSATKAALHSYSQSLRFQLRRTPVNVVEVIPPYVQTQLGGDSQATDPNAMPLIDYVSETMQILERDPSVEEVLVKRVLGHRFAAEGGQGKYGAYFKRYNERPN